MSIKVAIVGAGLSGLAAALFLRKSGAHVTVYEQSRELREVGAGIVVSPNMARPLTRLGLLGKLEAFAVRLEAAWEFRRWEDGRVLSVQRMEACRQLYGADCYVAHRADLMALFRDALPPEVLRLGHLCVGVEQDDRSVELTFENHAAQRSHVSADAVIAADGIHSTLRSSASADALHEPRFSGLCAFRCLVPASAGCLAGVGPESVPEALKRYESIRLPRASKVQLMSRGREVQNHLPDGVEQERRDAGFGKVDPLKQSAWLYGKDG